MRPARRHIALDMRLGSNRIEYQPLGVVGIISPWNYPVNLSLMPVVTAIAAGLHGNHRSTLISRMKKLGIDPRQYAT
jgi:hypothetical protein